MKIKSVALWLLAKAALVLTLSLADGCSAYSGAIAPPPANHNGPLATGTDTDCITMCAHLRILHCPAADPTPKGAPCEAVCENTESSGYASENPRCQSKATSCEAADACSDEASPP